MSRRSDRSIITWNKKSDPVKGETFRNNLTPSVSSFFGMAGELLWEGGVSVQICSVSVCVAFAVFLEFANMNFSAKIVLLQCKSAASSRYSSNFSSFLFFFRWRSFL